MTATPTKAIGPFEVKMTSQPWSESSTDQTLSRFQLDKQFQGDLEASSHGQMLSAGTAEKGSAGYVAIERVTGMLHGRKGSFVLMHTGVMNRGVPSLSIVVVPDSGTEELKGLTGSMDIIRGEGKHAYAFDYSLGERPVS